ncbi:flagellar filament capping protein FliD [Saccharospirillum mangrovi]|uniref:flagellar filament capping protein FliD n=1 Tax=Saccharospirillum mangrovi TaxID=2161747 RepID=UPI000D3773C3|nr:flagellar filament capping protein FliD [Saccharospirillum mangrovi]
MASVSSLGVGSGLLTSELLEDILAAEREATDLRLDRKQAEIETKITAYGELRSSLDKLQSATAALSNANTIKSSSATSSDESALTATTNTTASPGSYQIAIDQVASAHTLASKSYSSINDTVGTGTLTFSFGTTNYDGGGNYDSFDQNGDITSVSIDITSENNTLSGLRDTINKEVDGVTASLVFDGSGYRLLLTSEQTGEETSMEITASGDAGLQSLAYNSAQNVPGTNMTETQRGQDAILRINGLEVTSADNQVDQVIQGVTLNLNQVTTGNISLNVTRDTGEVADKMEAYVEAYNEFKLIYDEVTKYDPDSQEAGILLGDSAVRNLYSDVRNSMSTMVTGLIGGKYNSLSQVGLGTDRNNNFQLTFNRSNFIKALNDNADAMAGLLATQQTITDSQISFVTQTNKTQPGEYDIFIERAATQAQWQGLSTSALAFGSNLVIGGSNDSFTMELNGTTRTVTLEQGSYSSGDELALMIQDSINAAFNGSQTATVAFDASSQSLSITSSKFGSASTVNITGTDATVAETLGLGKAGQGGVNGQYFKALGVTGFAATSLPGTQTVTADQGINFSTNTVSFDLTVTGTGTGLDGVPTTITLDEDWSDIVDVNGNVTTDRDREDVLTYIQSELNDAGFNGIVSAAFDSSGRLYFRTEEQAGSQTLEISNTNVTGADFLGLQEGVQSSGVTINAGAEFQLSLDNRQVAVTSGLITVPPGTYETPADLAAAIETAINADATIQAGASGAQTTGGSRNINNTIDFASNPAQFQFNLNGTDHTIDVDANGTDNLDSIQQALDAELGAGVVTAYKVGNGLVLKTDAAGSSEILEITKDGAGASTAAGSVDLSTGIDFSASPASFTIAVDGIDIDVTVDGDGTAGSNDAESNLAMIQAALDEALVQSGGGGEFQAGDVVARLDASNQLYFETVSKNGQKTEATFGADSTIELKNTDANAQGVLGLADQGPLINGADGFGLDLGQYKGFDSTASVSYETDANGNGRFNISFGNDTSVEFNAVSTTAAVQLGFYLPSGNESDPVRGVDVKGTINGVEALGNGQYLTAQAGNESATNGYILGGPGADFSSSVVIDSTNNNFKFEIDGVESGTITLSPGAYNTGAALAAELKKQINADPALKAQGKSVDVQFDPDTGIFGVFSVSTGTQSTVRIKEIDAGAIDVFGMTTTSPAVDGKATVGERDPAAGLMIRVTGSKTGDRGSVSLVQGIFYNLDKSLDDVLGSSGLLSSREDALDEDLEGVEEERSTLDQRMAAMEARLQAKFIFNDQIISQLQTTENFLVQQFEAMNGGGD